ncbi:asparagine synthase (glutamine-hydrolyzing) [Streptomyces genisteinicus]|uniref:asparagine synthase (glutamine-hydrolyzing) n=1 Tax=Streptomyces genisteinicus TaxID=2768068 RepID=A0A7H0I4E7_9ACTN|nr:asparagine synthase (glutamine-hydrolyzing) [Streptomyces genisteinicus]QNP67663.1 asparagine synthase (glutamine-hydrolyzing) [Streptomyces genisteinicus]
MCGVCGTFSPHGGVDRSVAADMHSRLVHRGPDETYSLNTATLSVKLGRLGFTGLCDGWQPTEDRGGRFVATTNGEVFNFRSLRDSVGADPQGNGVDVSVIPGLVAEYGIDGLRLVDGQFATAILDRAENALYLARDRFGICPMYYTETPSGVHFCSEIKPLVQCVDRSWDVDVGAVDQYLSLGNVVAPRTLVKGIRAVPPGCAVRFDARGSHVVRYWRYGEFSPAAEPVAGEALREALRSSVRDRLHADVEIGAYLSGGFDSTAILMEAAAVTDHSVRSFSVVFDDPGLDEGRFQREVALAVGSKHEQVLCRRSDVASDFEKMVRHCCYPQRETYNVAARMLAGSVHSAGIKGVVSGEGADELFFGYDSYAFDSAARSRRSVRAENEQAWGRADFSWEVDWREVSRRRQDFLSPAAGEALHGDEFWRTRLIPFTEDEVRSLSAMQLRSIADVYVQMSGHLLGDHGDSMLMENSVEGRYPFLGNRVVSLALQVEDTAKVVDFEGKWCLKDAYAGIVPESVLRRGKHGFAAYDLGSVADARTWDDWRGLVEASGVFAPGCLGAPAGSGVPGKWDLRLSAISVAIVMDELGLGL